MQGIIALDIDGTVTAETHALDPAVREALDDLHHAGWKFIFITGRPFHWGYETLQSLAFPYALAVQNGALLLEMPARKILGRKYLKQDLFPQLEAICQDEQTDFVVYSGFEHDDWCFYRPGRLSSPILSYVMKRTEALGEKWHPLESFSQLPVASFSSIKFFAQKEQASRLSHWLEHNLRLHAPPNRDPYNPEFYVVQATHSEATKGDALQQFIQLTSASGPIIAAGDDYNDRSMLQLADVKIVMANAPAELLKLADVIAPPADQNGIIQGLSEGVHLLAEGKMNG